MTMNYNFITVFYGIFLGRMSFERIEAVLFMALFWVL